MTERRWLKTKGFALKHVGGIAATHNMSLITRVYYANLERLEINYSTRLIFLAQVCVQKKKSLPI